MPWLRPPDLPSSVNVIIVAVLDAVASPQSTTPLSVNFVIVPPLLRDGKGSERGLRVVIVRRRPREAQSKAFV